MLVGGGSARTTLLHFFLDPSLSASASASANASVSAGLGLTWLGFEHNQDTCNTATFAFALTAAAATLAGSNQQTKVNQPPANKGSTRLPLVSYKDHIWLWP